MRESVDQLVDLFRKQGLKITPQRRVIFETLINDNSHPTAEEVYRRVVSVMPDISRTTVYNTLRELVALGQLVEVEDLSQDHLLVFTKIGSKSVQFHGVTATPSPGRTTIYSVPPARP
jgi:Fe2+ or Zn2+ uptake regulation protein